MQGKIVIIGKGQTGHSCAQFLASRGIAHVMLDTQDHEALCQHALQAQSVLLSPGVPRAHPALAIFHERNIPIKNDIQLFVEHNQKPIIGITGTNGKSTVTTLVGEILAANGYRVGLGGNIGKPALALLTTPYDIAVLELSSYQLESCQHLPLAVAACLNVTPDHCDRYPAFQDYVLAKQSIFRHAEVAIYNKDDTNSLCDNGCDNKIGFSLFEPYASDYGIAQVEGEYYLAKGCENLLLTSQLRIRGSHNWANALAALAITEAMGVAPQASLETLKAFSGLPHRMQFVRTLNDVIWINDSKGTNIGATQAALQGLGSDMLGKIILIAGGQAKGQQFSSLGEVVTSYVRNVVLIGEDAPKIADGLADKVPIVYASDMSDAVMRAKHCAQPGDVVMLSPGCASFDMYNNFGARGDDFCALVEGLDT